MLSVFITFHGDSRSGESNSVEIKKKHYGGLLEHVAVFQNSVQDKIFDQPNLRQLNPP